MPHDNKPMISYVGWAGRAHDIEADFVLGYAKQRKVPGYGIRRAIWDAAFGYVNGFPVNAILYFVLTRSLNRRVDRWALRREGYPFADTVDVAPMPFTQGLFTDGDRS